MIHVGFKLLSSFVVDVCWRKTTNSNYRRYFYWSLPSHISRVAPITPFVQAIKQIVKIYCLSSLSVTSSRSSVSCLWL